MQAWNVSTERCWQGSRYDGERIHQPPWLQQLVAAGEHYGGYISDDEGAERYTGLMDLRNDFPIIPHESAGVDCCGCIVPVVLGSDFELAATNAVR